MDSEPAIEPTKADPYAKVRGRAAALCVGIAVLWVLAIAIRLSTALTVTYATGVTGMLLGVVGPAPLAALLTAAILRRAEQLLAILRLFAAMDFFSAVLMAFAAQSGAVEHGLLPWVDGGIALVIVLLIFGALRRELGILGFPRPFVAVMACVALLTALPLAADEIDMRWSMWMYGDNTETEQPRVEPDRLWEAQSGLVADAVKNIAAPVPGRGNLYVVGVATQGSQTLFAREAREAMQTLGAAYGGPHGHGLLLSNGAIDTLQVPLATLGNLSGALHALSAKIDPARDVVMIYFAAHGGRDAEVVTDLPSYDDLQGFTSGSVARLLDEAGIRRRILIVSACFSASWIPALANDDTIVIAAAARDRTSFGCSDERDLTYFGEAFLRGGIREGVSLADGFAQAKATVPRWEKQGQLTPSNPQAYVGKNMRALWEGDGAALLAGRY